MFDWLENHYPILSELERDLSVYYHTQKTFQITEMYVLSMVDQGDVMIIDSSEFGCFMIVPNTVDGSYFVTDDLKE